MSTQMILIVDDEPAVRETLDYLFKREGFATLIATNGEEALNILETVSPDLVVTDHTMPKVDGLEFVTIARARGLSFPVIVYSSEVSPAVKAKYGTQVTGFLNKPSTLEETMAEVLRCLPPRAA